MHLQLGLQLLTMKAVHGISFGLMTATADIDKGLSLSVSYKKDELERRHSACNSNPTLTDINVCGTNQVV